MTSKVIENLTTSRYNIVARRGESLYIANTLRRTSAKFDGPVGSIVQQVLDKVCFDGAAPSHLALVVEALREAGFIVSENYDELEEVKRLYAEETSSNKVLAAVIAPTMSCNMNCFYCYEKKYQNHLLDSKKILETLESKVPQGGSVSIQWHGGEPLLSLSVIKEISSQLMALASSRECSYSASITTNGSLLDSGSVRALAACGIKTAQITIDGDREYHDITRRIRESTTSSFERVLEGVSACKGHISVTLRVNVWRKNSESITELLEYLSSHQCRDAIGAIYFAPVFNYTNQSEKGKSSSYNPNTSTYFGVHEFAELESRLIEYAHGLGLPVNCDILKKSFATCVAVRHNSLVIEANGEVKKCYHDFGDTAASFGRIDDCLQLIDEEKEKLFTEFQPWNDINCAQCELLPVCLGGCPHKRIKGAERKEICPSFKYNLSKTLPFIIGENLN